MPRPTFKAFMTQSNSDRIWYFVRHGETEWNAERRMQGQWDSRLSENGIRHADTNGKWLASQGVEHVWASPLGRVKQTAELIGKHVPLAQKPVWDDRLKEWSSGDWSGELYADIRTKYSDQWSAWMEDRYGYRPPNGENFQDLEVRSDSFLAEASEHPSRVRAILAHGFIIRVMVGRLAGLTPEDVLSVKQTNETVIRARETNDGIELDHFVAGEGPFPGLPRGEQGAA